MGVLCVFFTTGIIHELPNVRQRRREDERGEGKGEGENFWCKRGKSMFCKQQKTNNKLELHTTTLQDKCYLSLVVAASPSYV